MKRILVSGAGVQSRTLGFQGKNLQDRAAEVVDVADGSANSGRQENEVRGRQAGADNVPRAIAMNVLTLLILRGHLWRGRFQSSVIKERQVTSGNGRNLSGR